MGTPGEEIRGTAGSDVVITNGAATVSTLAGDDLVCITGDADGTFATTGAGSDRIDASATRRAWLVTVQTGSGADEFIGGPARDQVRGSGATHDDADAITTAGGRDSVVIGRSGGNTDVIKMGSEADTVFVQGAFPKPMIRGGEGRDKLVMFLQGMNAESWEIDNKTQRMTADGAVVARWRSVASFEPSIPGSATFIGGPSQEFLSIAVEDRPSVDIRMGGEDDRLQVFGSAPGGRLDGGAGRDSVAVLSTATHGSMSLDLASGGFVAAGPNRRTAMSALHFENASLLGELPLFIKGTNGANHLRGRSEFSPVTLHGLAGADNLQGGQSDDVLVGGLGHDIADGGFGIDRCDTEVRKHCER